MTMSRTLLTAYTGLVAALLGGLLLALPTPGTRLAGSLLVATVPIGAAITCWFDCGEDSAQAGLTVVLSLALVGTAGAVSLWTSTWSPRAVLLSLAGIGVLSCVARLRYARSAAR